MNRLKSETQARRKYTTLCTLKGIFESEYDPFKRKKLAGVILSGPLQAYQAIPADMRRKLPLDTDALEQECKYIRNGKKAKRKDTGTKPNTTKDIDFSWVKEIMDKVRLEQSSEGDLGIMEDPDEESPNDFDKPIMFLGSSNLIEVLGDY